MIKEMKTLKFGSSGTTYEIVDETARKGQTLQNNTVLSNGTIPLTYTSSIYQHTPTGSTTYTFSTGNLVLDNSLTYTFELHIKLNSVYSLTFPASVTWESDTIPDLSLTGTYYLVFRTTDGGSTWNGNLQGKW